MSDRPPAAVPPAVNGRRPLLSVVITSYSTDRLKDVEEALDSLQAQTYANLEMIFVGENTRSVCDHVVAYARERAITNLTTLFNDGTPGLSAARNLGIERAQGEIIAFLDDDAVAFPDWAQEMADSLAADDGPIAVTGPAFPAWQHESMDWFPEEFFWIISCRVPSSERERTHEVRNVWGVNMGFRREAFDRGAFDERLGGNMGAADGSKLGLLGEDTLFSIRLGRETGRPLVYNPRLRVKHKVHAYRLNPRFVQRRAFWEGYTKAWLKRVSGRNGSAAGDVLAPEYKLLRRILLTFFPRVAAGLVREPARSRRQAWLAVNALTHVGLGYAAAISGRLGSAVCRRYQR